MSTRFLDYHKAREVALARANQTGLDMVIRKQKEFGTVGFNVSFASRNDNDYARYEVVKPGDLP